MSPVAPDHVQAVGPVRPARLVRRDLVRERATARAEEREGQTRREERRARAQWEVRLVPTDVRERCTGARRDLTDHGDLDAFGKVLQALADGEFNSTVDIVEIFQAGILERRM